MIIGYGRVSTTKSEQDISINAQIDQLKAAGCVRIFAERRSAFKRGVRPEWEKVKDAVTSGLVTRVVLINLQRTSRQCEGEGFLELCARHNVEVAFLDGTSTNINDPATFATIRISETMHKMDSMFKSTAVNRALERRRSEGHTCVGRCPFGYRYNGSQPEPHPEQWAEAKRLWNLLKRNEFRVPHTIRLEDLDWSAPGLYRWLRNPMLYGHVHYSNTSTTPLVSYEEWSAMRKIIDGRRKHMTRSVSTLKLFSGAVICKTCGRCLSYQYSYGKPRLKCQHLKCAWYGRGLAESKVRKQLIDALRTAVPEMVQLVEKATQTKDRQLTAEQIAAQQQLDQLLALQSSGVPALDKAISDLRKQLVVPMDEAPPDWTGLADVLSVSGVLEGMTDMEFRAVMLELVDEILYVGNPTAVEIRLR